MHCSRTSCRAIPRSRRPWSEQRVYGLSVAALPVGAIVAGLAAAALIRRFGSARVAVFGTIPTSLGILGAGLVPRSCLLCTRSVHRRRHGRDHRCRAECQRDARPTSQPPNDHQFVPRRLVHRCGPRRFNGSRRHRTGRSARPPPESVSWRGTGWWTVSVSAPSPAPVAWWSQSAWALLSPSPQSPAPSAASPLPDLESRRFSRRDA